MSRTTIQTYPYTPGVLYLEGEFCYLCGVAFGLERSYRKERLRNHRLDFYCPNGHSQCYVGETEEQRLKLMLEAERDNAVRIMAERDQIESSRRAYKGQATKLRNRTLAGECPICGQHLRDVARHVSRQHPDEKPEAEDEQ